MQQIYLEIQPTTLAVMDSLLFFPLCCHFNASYTLYCRGVISRLLYRETLTTHGMMPCRKFVSVIKTWPLVRKQAKTVILSVGCNIACMRTFKQFESINLDPVQNLHVTLHSINRDLFFLRSFQHLCTRAIRLT